MSGISHSRTEELAWKLGAVEVVDVNRMNIIKAVPQYFDYLVVLDFEATCWSHPAGHGKNNEIIEFSAVLYDITEKKIIDHFQQYVQPTEMPILSDFCSNLTGITQSHVENGVPIGSCLMIFTRWIAGHQKKLNFTFPSDVTLPGKKKCVLVTWSNWDLGTCLLKECKRKNIYKQDFFCRWIDLREIFTELYRRKPKGLLDALQNAGLDFIGRQHCGLDDAKNTAFLARKMIDDGAFLRVTKDLCK